MAREQEPAVDLGEGTEAALGPVVPHPGDPFAVQVCSVFAAAERLERPLAQVQMLAGSHALGRPFVAESSARGRGAADARFYLKSEVERLAAAPRRKKEDVLRMLAEGAFPNDVIVILRQRDPLFDPDFLQALDAGGDAQAVPVRRRWYGFDVCADRSGDEDLVRGQDDASRMYWPIAPRSRDLVSRAKSEGKRIPCLISVGGLVLGAREIVDFDFDISDRADAKGYWAFKFEPAGDWAKPFMDTWLESGPGKSILWWRAEDAG